MKLSYVFRSLSDWSAPQTGLTLFELLRSFELHTEKIGEVEPLRHEYDPEWLATTWRNTGKELQLFSLGFTGSGSPRFQGTVGWKLGISPSKKLFNALTLTLTYPKTRKPASSWLLSLGDALFQWSEAVHGFITDPIYDKSMSRPIVLRPYLEGPYWVNYLGRAYISDQRFRMTLPAVSVGHGLRLELAESPDDARLSDEEFLRGVRKMVGEGWWGEGSERLIPDLPFANLSIVHKS